MPDHRDRLFVAVPRPQVIIDDHAEALPLKLHRERIERRKNIGLELQEPVNKKNRPLHSGSPGAHFSR